MTPLGIVALAVAAILVGGSVVACVRARRVPWRQGLLWVYQVGCGLRGHRFGDREMDPFEALPLFSNPYIRLCTRCGASVVRGADEVW